MMIGDRQELVGSDPVNSGLFVELGATCLFVFLPTFTHFVSAACGVGGHRRERADGYNGSFEINRHVQCECVVGDKREWQFDC